ncbi:MAG: DUF4105 domain-containing protein [Pseudobacteriovorax sp.]|nr:DUF4105 domain-containing protein [Pseudobacteriovorax sp.]
MALSQAETNVLASKQNLAKSKELYLQREWRKILFIPDRFYTSDESLIDDERFFFADNGKHEPRDEMLASLQAFYENKRFEHNGKEDYPQCVWAARFAYLDRELDLVKDGFPRGDCPAVRAFINYASYEKASLIFSNYYLNNPSSMFGHSFIRLHRKPRPGANFSADLLDDTINFSAFVTDSAWNPLFPLKGLIGSYKGRFAMLPFYSKVQEYNNYESRDIWQFDLNLTSEEIEKMMLVLWEQGAFYMDYYFLDDNCAYILLMLFESARPSLELTAQLPLYAIPSDSIRAVREAGIVTNVEHRHSVLSRLMARYDKLEEDEAVLLTNLPDIVDNKSSFPEDCEADCQSKILDTAIELLDYKIAFNEGEEKRLYAASRPDFLLARSRIPERSLTLEKGPISSRVDRGHDSAYISFAAGVSDAETGGSLGSLRWKPALHDLASPPEGYGRGMELGFLDSEVRFEEERAFVKHVDLLNIISIPDQHPLVQPSSWAFDLGYMELPFCPADKTDYCRRVRMKAVIGANKDLGRWRLYALAGLSLSSNKAYRGSLMPTFQQGVIAHLSQTLRFDQRVELEYETNRSNALHYLASAKLIYQVETNRDIHLAFESSFGRRSYQVASGFYF